MYSIFTDPKFNVFPELIRLAVDQLPAEIVIVDELVTETVETEAVPEMVSVPTVVAR